MKKLKLLSMLFIVIALTGTGCLKSIIDDPESLLIKGSASLTINGKEYSKLSTSVIETKDGVAFSLIDEATGDPFMVAISPVPEIGETDTLALEGDDDATAILFYGSPIPDYSVLLGGAGTVKRTSKLKYEIDATLYGGDTFEDQFPLKGKVTVGTVMDF